MALRKLTTHSTLSSWALVCSLPLLAANDNAHVVTKVMVNELFRNRCKCLFVELLHSLEDLQVFHLLNLGQHSVLLVHSSVLFILFDIVKELQLQVKLCPCCLWLLRNLSFWTDLDGVVPVSERHVECQLALRCYLAIR